MKHFNTNSFLSFFKSAPKHSDDQLYGMRVHSWILVEAGKREVPESFFIEPFTGLPQPLLNERYLGIESVWNHQNYWANMQDCSKGVMEMTYDLGDCTKWEFMFPTNEKPVLLLPDEDIDIEFDDEVDNNAEVEKHLDMPRSWVEPLNISLNDFQMRYPGGKKTIFYKKAKLEKFALYLMPDGLVNRVSIYEDTGLSNLIQVNEYFLNRTDRLHTREYDHRKCWIHEYFHEGRPRCLKEHLYKFNSTSPESERTMIFYHNARVDGLEMRKETPTEMTENFVGREDFLFYRYTEFGRRQHVFAPQNMPDTVNDRPIIKIIEKFHRNPNKAANDDIFIRTFTENKISIVYHTDDKCITYSTRDFLKLSTWTDKNAPNIGWNPELHASFQVGPSASIKKEVDLYQFLRQMLNEEVQSRDAVRKSELEVKTILDARLNEEAACNLEVSVYDTQRNEKARARREKMKEKQELEERLKREAMEVDYLAPFLVQINDPEQLTKLEASSVQKACLEDLRHRLLEKANLIQRRFEKETSELLKKQEWYQKNQISMQKEDEDEYSNYVEGALFRIHILEVRLNRHKEMATQKYKALERKLRSDPRLSELYN